MNVARDGFALPARGQGGVDPVGSPKVFSNRRRSGQRKSRLFEKAALFRTLWFNLTLACFETTLGFVDHIYTALTAHHAAITVAVFQRPERIFDLHGSSPYLGPRMCPSVLLWWARLGSNQ